jgi:aspartate-semialdehyde dehydrogenase
MLDQFGAASGQKLEAIRGRVRAETKACSGSKVANPAIQVIHAPVFYGTTFSAWAELDASADAWKIAKHCEDAGFALIAEGETGPSNLTAAGESVIQLARPEPDPALAGTWWFWGAADNIRLPAWNALKLAEKLAG